MSRVSIRPATAGDAALIFRFVRELASYEKALDEVVTDEAELREALFGEGARGAHALICELDGAPAGFALYFYSFSTWVGRYGIFLEDLYVSPEYRGRGAGKALLRYLAQLAVREGLGRFEWNVLDWNEPSIRFYEACGAQSQPQWVEYRLCGDALRRFAQGDSDE